MENNAQILPKSVLPFLFAKFYCELKVWKKYDNNLY